MLSTDFLFRYAILLAGCICLLRLIYFRYSPKREMVFSFFLFSNGVFLITYLIHGIELSMGFAFGLFAVFAMLRYRTESISIRDMTYLFVVIGMALMCAIANLGWLELTAIVALICFLSAVGETRWLAPEYEEHVVLYDEIRNIVPQRRDTLINDLKRRTGLDIVSVRIGKIDFLTDSASIVVLARREPEVVFANRSEAVPGHVLQSQGFPD